ncbi:MAG: hypothetical protein A3C84_03655 [Candidatus Ryanbacteria bacterium RIFCSPHIGHO2_02_FULL_48_12]|uniref:Probable endolytic peptidoglycan transglycosylase RlpA n=1 Tax=Candidatus Ryanbacteria bacterium RIFCSPHIGHO2_01_FULL_48_27 TaxID=1802115 RepID=A0A1G2G6H4_9BACT|nr:MAG: hypothetical protein A2756_03025 [Candidatus Ryanbacteria bacterium RIFCSPHIGHO2_01_FULL_48_27]OGZ49436.1 MAG: hypothetical protein A3C84_03655 [Candidatus Ryanbacteria bacterium RIFCSPHIGHO2_02_FULL_48_12]
MVVRGAGQILFAFAIFSLPVCTDVSYANREVKSVSTRVSRVVKHAMHPGQGKSATHTGKRGMHLCRVLYEDAHMVVEGDSIPKIVSRLQERWIWVNPEQVVKKNRLRDPDKLTPGQILKIPVCRWKEEEGIASWYGPGFHGKPMASTKKFNQNNPSVVAHREFPMGTQVIVTNLETGKSITAWVMDRGPYKKGRVLDLSRAGAEVLGMKEKGTAWVKVVPIYQPRI